MSTYIYVKPKKVLKTASSPTNAGVNWSYLVTTMFREPLLAGGYQRHFSVNTWCPGSCWCQEWLWSFWEVLV